MCDIRFLCRSYNCFVDSLPVVEVLSLAPEFLEERLTLAYGYRGIEIPGIGISESVSGIIPGTIPVNSSFIFRIHLCSVVPSPSFFLFLLSFQGSYHTVDGCIPVSLVHFGKRLQGILEGDGIGIRHQFVQHLGAMSQLRIILSVLIEQADCFAIAALGISISSGFPIQIAQTQ